ncbi:TNF receptor-associated factor 6-like isoform X1 [Acropora palmata]|uniref:TNF receptor-associated factor 6-like isoform X1 n=1 Tax=Acropora palmata TaxID=6131 RepID=UPI003DA0DF88
MASAIPKSPVPSGYEYDFLSLVDEDFICQICHLPLKQAILTRCGHRFCNECLNEYFRRLKNRKQNPECPCDREKIDTEKDIFPDKASQRKILSYKVKCPSDGCQWTGELRDVETHEESCIYKIIECTHYCCNIRLPRHSLDEHLETSCLWRIVQCPYCGQRHPKAEDELHNEACVMLPLTCACHEVIPRMLMQNHKETECTLTLLPCPYLELGCTSKVERRNQKKHLLDQTSSHLSLACEKLLSLREEFNEQKAKLKKQMDDLKKENESLSLKLSAHEKETSKPKMETPVFVWKISGFSEMLRQAKQGRNSKIDSTPFYTSSYGYKLKVSVNPNGDGSGKNTHLSAFVIVMKGEYDGMLPWPFSQKVSFTLIDQQESLNERENIVMHFKSNTRLENFARPVSEENPGRGYARFVSHERLKSRRFIVDDTLFIQVDVGPL